MPCGRECDITGGGGRDNQEEWEWAGGREAAYLHCTKRRAAGVCIGEGGGVLQGVPPSEDKEADISASDPTITILQFSHTHMQHTACTVCLPNTLPLPRKGVKRGK